MSKQYPINPEWEIYYYGLEAIRCTGICNMWGAAPYLADLYSIDETLAREILLSWIENYDELNKKYGWQ
jgi:hypothetical protein